MNSQLQFVESFGFANKLQKFAQYLLNELPKSHLSLAQEILDQLMKNHFDQIDGGPDPTAGATVDANHEWLLDSNSLQERIRRTLTKFCSPSPIVSDPNYFNTYDSIFQQEYTYLLRALRNREPQGIWSLLKIGIQFIIINIYNVCMYCFINK